MKQVTWKPAQLKENATKSNTMPKQNGMACSPPPYGVGLIDRSIRSADGKALPGAIRSSMESAFGADFSTVRIHLDSLSVPQGASACTAGEDIYFARGCFNPDDKSGKHLIGHELVHVQQQRQGGLKTIPGNFSVNHDSLLEQEADAIGLAASQEQRVQIQGRSNVPSVQLGWSDISQQLVLNNSDAARQQLETDAAIANELKPDEFQAAWQGTDFEQEPDNRKIKVFRSALANNIVSQDFLLDAYLGIFQHVPAPPELLIWSRLNATEIQKNQDFQDQWVKKQLPLPTLKAALLEGKITKHQQALKPNEEPGKIFTYHLLDKTEDMEAKFARGYFASRTLYVMSDSLSKVLNNPNNITQSTKTAVQSVKAAIDEAFKWAILLYEYAKDDLSANTLKQIQIISSILIDEIASLPQQSEQMVLLPSGSSGHATLSRVSRQVNNLYRLIQYNTGSGIDKHAVMNIHGVNKYQTFLEKPGVSKAELEDPGLWTAVIANKVNPDMGPVYRRLETLSTNANQNNPLSIEYFEQKQRLGSCTWQSVMAFLRQYILESHKNDPVEGLLQYKILKAELSNVIFHDLQNKTGITDSMRMTGSEKLVKRQRYLVAKDQSITTESTSKAAELALNTFVPDTPEKNMLIQEFVGKVKDVVKQGNKAQHLDALYRLLVHYLDKGKAVITTTKNNNPVIAAALVKYQETRAAADPEAAWKALVHMNKWIYGFGKNLQPIYKEFKTLTIPAVDREKRSHFIYTKATALLLEARYTESQCDALLSDDIIKNNTTITAAINAYKRKTVAHMTDPLAELEKLLKDKSLRQDLTPAMPLLSNANSAIKNNPSNRIKEQKNAIVSVFASLNITNSDIDVLNKMFVDAKNPFLKAQLFDVILHLQ